MNNPGDPKPRTLHRLFKEQNGICFWCNMPMVLDFGNHKLSASLDHLVPKNRVIAVNGKTTLTEKTEWFGKLRPSVAAHRLCNSQRGHNDSISISTFSRIKQAVKGHFGIDSTLNAERRVYEIPSPGRSLPANT